MHADILELRAIRREYPEYDVEAITLGIMGLSNTSIRSTLEIGRRYRVPAEHLVPSVKLLLARHQQPGPASGSEDSDRE